MIFFVKYALAGGSAAVLQTLALYIWVSILGLQTHYLWGVVIGFCIATAVGFLLQKYWTFASREQQHMPQKQFIFFVVLALLGLGLNTLLLRASKGIFESMGFNFFHIWYIVAEVVVIFFIAALSFVINYFFIFKSSRT